MFRALRHQLGVARDRPVGDCEPANPLVDVIRAAAPASWRIAVPSTLDHQSRGSTTRSSAFARHTDGSGFRCATLPCPSCLLSAARVPLWTTSKHLIVRSSGLARVLPHRVLHPPPCPHTRSAAGSPTRSKNLSGVPRGTVRCTGSPRSLPFAPTPARAEDARWTVTVLVRGTRMRHWLPRTVDGVSPNSSCHRG